jgi:hypothetical protein
VEAEIDATERDMSDLLSKAFLEEEVIIHGVHQMHIVGNYVLNNVKIPIGWRTPMVGISQNLDFYSPRCLPCCLEFAQNYC